MQLKEEAMWILTEGFTAAGEVTTVVGNGGKWWQRMVLDGGSATVTET